MLIGLDLINTNACWVILLWWTLFCSKVPSNVFDISIIIIFNIRWLLSTTQDACLKPVLWFCHIMAGRCSSSVFTTDELRHQLIDLLQPVGAEKVVFMLNLINTLTFLQYPLDYLSTLDPAVKDLDSLALEFGGLQGTHHLADQTLKLLLKFTKPNWTWWNN